MKSVKGILPQSHLAFGIRFVHVDAGYEEGGARHCAIQHLHVVKASVFVRQAFGGKIQTI
jgi:hypothetical protein